MSAIVFGEADPKDYMEPLCARCGHMRSEHCSVDPEYMALACSHGWDDDGDEEDEGCDCLCWVART